MLHDVIIESLRFLDRDALDACQLASKSVRKFIDGSPTLPLRSIGKVYLGSNIPTGRPMLLVSLNADDDVMLDWLDEMPAGDVSSLVHLRNAYIECVELLTGAHRCVTLLRGASAALHFEVGRLRYDENLQETETLHESVDWIVRDLRVTDYSFDLSDSSDDHGTCELLPSALTHSCVRATAEYLSANVYTRSPVIFAGLFDLLFDAPKLAADLQFGFHDGTKFADGFIRIFGAAADTLLIARSVTITQCFYRHEPYSYLPAMCTAPRKQNVEAPKTRYFGERLRAGRVDMQKCDLYVFENDAWGKELQLFVMTARPVAEYVEDLVDLVIMTFIIY